MKSKERLTIGQEIKLHICNFNAETEARRILSNRHKVEYKEIIERQLVKEIKKWDSQSDYNTPKDNK